MSLIRLLFWQFAFLHLAAHNKLFVLHNLTTKNNEAWSAGKILFLLYDPEKNASN